MKRILLTGGSGIIGGHIKKLLGGGSRGVEIVCFDADLTDMSAINDALATAGPLDGVVHLAAMVATDEVRADPTRAYAVNVGGTLNLLGALAKMGQAEHVFLCSSAHVYAPQSGAIKESALTEPVSLYGRTKLMAEIVATDICNTYDIPLCIGRVFSIHDAKQVGSYLLPNIRKRLANEDLSRPFELYGADSIRDFLTARNAAEIIANLVIKHYTGVVNIGSGKPTRIRDFVQKLTRNPLDIRAVGGQNSLLADTTRLDAFVEVHVE